MGASVAYIARKDRGARLDHLRLVGVARADEWSPPGDGGADVPSVTAECAKAGEWIAQRLAANGSRGSLNDLVLDSDGSYMAWLTSPTTNRALVKAAYADLAQAGGSSSSDGDPGEPGVGVQSLAAPLPSRPKAKDGEAPEGRRMAVLAVPDTSARLVLDELDRRGVSVGRVRSLWHAVAIAWDAGGPVAGLGGDGARPDRVVATDAQVSATVVMDIRGTSGPRLVWAWSRGGELLAGGTIRLLARLDGAGSSAVVTADDVGRMLADWLAWSVQLGQTPSRVNFVGAEGDDHPGGLSVGDVGVLIGKRWPSASVDVRSESDPMSATLHRLARVGDQGGGALAGPGAEVVHLTHRPGRAHRTMHIWLAIALAAASLAMVAWSYVAEREASRLREAANGVRSSVRDVLKGVDPAFADAPRPRDELATRIEDLEKQLNVGEGVSAPRPVLQELENLAILLSGFAGEGLEVQEIRIDRGIPQVELTLPDTVDGTRAADELPDALQRIASNVAWQRRFAGQVTPSATPGQPGRQKIQLFGPWRAPAAGGTP